jgi:signal transduction histidine kinase
MSAPRVLVADDEPSLRWTMAEFLRRGGYEPVTAADFGEAAAALSETEVDAAVIDVTLFGRGGPELLRELAERAPGVPVIAITAAPEYSLDREMCAGAYDFIAKPILKDALLRAVARAVEKKRLTDEVRRLRDGAGPRAAELERAAEGRARELIEAHRALARQEKIAAVGRATAQVAHEVKNPLAGLLLYAMHLRNKAADKLTESELALVGRIIDTINHLSATVEQVLDYARPPTLSRHPADLNRVVADVLELLRPQAEANLVEPRLELDERGCHALIDVSSVRTALANVILNAVQSMPGGGTLGVKTEAGAASAGGAARGVARVEITDTGAGMTAEQIENAFEPFYTTKVSGLGLGLPQARKVFEAHGGIVSVESLPGHGTTIRVELPGETGEG